MRRIRLAALAAVVLSAAGSAPVSAHTNPETGASVPSGPVTYYSAPSTLDGKTFTDPKMKIHLRDNAPTKWIYNGAQTSITASIQFDVMLTPGGPCPSSPSGAIDIKVSEVGPDPTHPSPWKTTNWFDKSTACSASASGQTWHFEDSLGPAGQYARDFEIRLVDRMTGSVYVSAFVLGEFVTPRDPSALAITSTSSIAVNLAWQDNSLWENHMEVQRTGGPNDTWATIDRVTNSGRGTVTYQDYVPVTPSATVYRYRVRAISGDKTSAWTPVVATSAPATPTGFAAQAEPREVALTWNSTYGEDHYEIERSQDAFATIQRQWTVAADQVSFTDVTSEGVEDYQYRIRGVNVRGASAWATLAVSTPGFFEPMVPEFLQAREMNCPGPFPTLGAAMTCTREQMYEYRVYVYEIEICYHENGVELPCTKHLLALPSSRPTLPDDDDPSVPPPVAPDGTRWVPPHAPGENPWKWGPEDGDFPTHLGSWSRYCSGTAGPKEQLHWDAAHPLPKPAHWGFVDCLGEEWEMPFEWETYGKTWFPKGYEWWNQ